MARKTQTDPAIEKFFARGLDYLVNRAILHAVGMELYLEDGAIRIRDHTDEPYQHYAGRAWKETRGRFLKFMKSQGNALMQRRKATLGYVVQPEPGTNRPQGAAE